MGGCFLLKQFSKIRVFLFFFFFLILIHSMYTILQFTCSGQRGQQTAVNASFLPPQMSVYLLISPQLSSQHIKSICLPTNTSLNIFCPSLILVAYVQEVEVSARQYPRQPAISSHIYRMHSSFPVLCSSLSSSQVMCVCVWLWMRALPLLHECSSCIST